VAGLAGRDATGRSTWYYARCVPESTGDLVGRRAELDILQRALVDLETGAPRVVQIAGEPGIGKNRLVAELRAEAERAHHLGISGRAAEFEDGEAFGVHVDALDDYLASVDPRDLERLNLELAQLAWVFPAGKQDGEVYGSRNQWWNPSSREQVRTWWIWAGSAVRRSPPTPRCAARWVAGGGGCG
jgi:AAA ATPase domain